LKHDKRGMADYRVQTFSVVVASVWNSNVRSSVAPTIEPKIALQFYKKLLEYLSKRVGLREDSFFGDLVQLKALEEKHG
jgi:hypothetical protein